MKFGKQLARVVDSSDPEWAPYWVNYKLLKKKIKELPRGSFPSKNNQGKSDPTPPSSMGGRSLQGGGPVMGTFPRRGAAASTTERSTGGGEGAVGVKAAEATEKEGGPACCGRVGCPGSNGLQQASVAAGGGLAFNANEQISALSRSPEEAAFFKLVNKELQKVVQFFCSVEGQMLGRLNHVREGMKLIDMDTVLGKDQASWRHLLAACIKLYKDLLRLENYAIVAWTSVSKIMKKHDKWTGFCTRHRFMQNVVNKLPITHYPRTVDMLEEVEGMYQRVHRIKECSQFKCSSLQDEVLFIETIRGINKEVSRIQEEEHKDAGITPPLSKKQRKEQAQQQHEQQQQEAAPTEAVGGGDEVTAPMSSSSSSSSSPVVEAAAVRGGGVAE